MKKAILIITTLVISLISSYKYIIHNIKIVDIEQNEKNATITIEILKQYHEFNFEF